MDTWYVYLLCIKHFAYLNCFTLSALSHTIPILNQFLYSESIPLTPVSLYYLLKIVNKVIKTNRACINDLKKRYRRETKHTFFATETSAKILAFVGILSFCDLTKRYSSKSDSIVSKANAKALASVPFRTQYILYHSY